METNRTYIMRQQTTAVTEAHISLLIMFLFLVLAIAFLAIINVQTTIPLPDEKTAVAFFVDKHFI